MEKEKEKLVYCGLVYMGDEPIEYREYFSEKYKDNAELRNEEYDEIHQYRAELYATQEILDSDFGGKPKLIS